MQRGVYDEPLSGFFRNVDTRYISNDDVQMARGNLHSFIPFG